MPLKSRDPGGWMSPRYAREPEQHQKPSHPEFSSRSEPVARPAVAPTGDPFMPATRTSLIGLT
jgi:hypothetical protein